MTDLMHIPGLISEDERELLRNVAARAQAEFDEDPYIVHLGLFMGASAYCTRVGAPEAIIYGVDVNDGVLDGTEEDKKILDLRFMLGDTREVYKAYREANNPIHMIFVDSTHSSEVVTAEIQNWILPCLVKNGYCLFHDAYYEEGDTWYRLKAEVGDTVDKFFSPKDWEEQPRVDTTRWFRRLR